MKKGPSLVFQEGTLAWKHPQRADRGKDVRCALQNVKFYLGHTGILAGIWPMRGRNSVAELELYVETSWLQSRGHANSEIFWHVNPVFCVLAMCVCNVSAKATTRSNRVFIFTPLIRGNIYWVPTTYSKHDSQCHLHCLLHSSQPPREVGDITIVNSIPQSSKLRDTQAK